LIFLQASFNSSVGILSVGTDHDWRHRALGSRFNSSVGILSVGTSGRLDDYVVIFSSFNSSVGILSVGTQIDGAFRAGTISVSIPQSEFCPLGRNVWVDLMPEPTAFQFLSRNSVRWDVRK